MRLTQLLWHVAWIWNAKQTLGLGGIIKPLIIAWIIRLQLPRVLRNMPMLLRLSWAACVLDIFIENFHLSNKLASLCVCVCNLTWQCRHTILPDVFELAHAASTGSLGRLRDGRRDKASLPLNIFHSRRARYGCLIIKQNNTSLNQRIGLLDKALIPNGHLYWWHLPRLLVEKSTFFLH